jgi:hypothetical protein
LQGPASAEDESLEPEFATHPGDIHQGRLTGLGLAALPPLEVVEEHVQFVPGPPPARAASRGVIPSGSIVMSTQALLGVVVVVPVGVLRGGFRARRDELG